MSADLGIYIHVPFCSKKCDYCAFYSLIASESKIERYTAEIEKEIHLRGVPQVRPVATLYFGGGTPSLLGGQRIARIISAVRNSFNVSQDVEITLEANPADDLYSCFKKAAQAGVNRVSLGVQSAVESELKMLGRRHNNADVIRTVQDLKRAGIDNFSVDLMLGIPGQTSSSLNESIDFILSLQPKHVSAYILKIEESTPLAVSSALKNLPGEDEAAELYEQLCGRLATAGFYHYEISNFAIPGYESRHNLRYWRDEDYLGFGPAAHSYDNGLRFYCKADLSGYLNAPEYVPDGSGGDIEENLMLAFRLAEGINIKTIEDKYNVSLQKLKEKATMLAEHGLCYLEDGRVGLTESGMLLSNAVIYELISTLEETE